MDIPNLRVHASVIALAATQSKLLVLVYDSLACVRKLSESGARKCDPKPRFALWHPSGAYNLVL